MTKKGKLIILSGPSGTGKSTVVFKAMEGRQDLCFSTSVTTRSPRSGEVDGREYFFIDQARFDEMVEKGELLEHARYVSNSYGTPRPFVEAQLRKGMNVILDIEVQGARGRQTGEGENAGGRGHFHDAAVPRGASPAPGRARDGETGSHRGENRPGQGRDPGSGFL